MNEIDMKDKVNMALSVLAFVSDVLSASEQLSDKGRAGAAEVIDMVADSVAEAVGLEVESRAVLSLVV
jgi:hypothetical protein